MGGQPQTEGVAPERALSNTLSERIAALRNADPGVYDAIRKSALTANDDSSRLGTPALDAPVSTETTEKPFTKEDLLAAAREIQEKVDMTITEREENPLHTLFQTEDGRVYLKVKNEAMSIPGDADEGALRIALETLQKSAEALGVGLEDVERVTTVETPTADQVSVSENTPATQPIENPGKREPKVVSLKRGSLVLRRRQPPSFVPQAGQEISTGEPATEESPESPLPQPEGGFIRIEEGNSGVEHVIRIGAEAQVFESGDTPETQEAIACMALEDLASEKNAA